MKILYVFTGGRKERFKRILAGEGVPTDFLYGAPELSAEGYEVDIVELTDLKPSTRSVLKRIHKKFNWFKDLSFGFLDSSHLMDPIKMKNFDQYDLIIAGNDYIGVGLLYHHDRGVFSTPVSFFGMGLFGKFNHKMKKKGRGLLGKILVPFYAKKTLKNVKNIFFLGEGEFKFACDMLPAMSNKFMRIPFYVDTNFWRPHSNKDCCRGDYILFIGNDLRRDYELLLKIAETLSELKFIFISKYIKKAPDNVTVINSDWHKMLLSDEQIRGLILGARLVILPIKAAQLQPSGQSVCQQSMACGKTVLISDTPGFWAPDVLKNGEHLILVENNEVDTWTKTIRKVYNDDALLDKIGRNASTIIRDDFSTDKYVNFIKEVS